jgi:excinuclease ABC subunit B
MKKIMLIMFLATITLMMFTACSDDDNNNNVEPETIKKAIKDGIEKMRKAKGLVADIAGFKEKVTDDQVLEVIVDLEQKMEEAARNLNFERAIKIRDELKRLRQ